MKRLLVFIMAVLTLVLFGCNCADTQTPPAVSDGDATVSDTQLSQTNTVEYAYYGGAPGTPLIIEDLDIFYKGVIINGDTTAEEFEETLGAELALSGENIDGVNAMSSPYYTCSFKTLYYPDRENPDFLVYYVYNETLEIARIHGMYIYTGSVGRGISVGDSADNIIEVYGNSMEDGVYSYYTNPETNSNSIYFIVDPETNTIIGAGIIYGLNDIMEEWSLTPYID